MKSDQRSAISDQPEKMIGRTVVIPARFRNAVWWDDDSITATVIHQETNGTFCLQTVAGTIFYGVEESELQKFDISDTTMAAEGGAKLKAES